MLKYDSEYSPKTGKQQDAWKGRYLQDRDNEDRDEWNQQHRMHELIVLHDGVGQLVCDFGIIITGSLDADDGVQNDRNAQ